MALPRPQIGVSTPSARISTRTATKTTTTTSSTRLKPRARRRRAAAGGRTRSTLAEHGLAEAPDRRQHAEREDQHQHRKADDQDRLDLRGEILEVEFHVPLVHPGDLEHELVQ